MSDYYERLANIESGGKSDAKSKTSSATGKYQLTRDTYADLQKKAPWLQYTSWEEHRANPKAQEQAVRALTAQNEDIMRRRGHELTDLNRYLYHFAGAGGANRLLGAKQDAKIADILGKEAIKANQFMKNMTVADLKNHFGKKLGVKEQVMDNASTPPWELYRSMGVGAPTRFAQGGDVKPWELYRAQESALAAQQTPKRVAQAQASAPAEPMVMDPENPFAYIPEAQKSEQGRFGKAIGRGIQKGLRHGAGVAQGAIIDPVMAVAQILPWEKANEFARESNDRYNRFRTNMGGNPQDTDWGRLVGNIVSPIAIKGANLASKAIPKAGRFTQGASQGALGATLQPILDEEGQLSDENLVSSKVGQLGVGAVTGGAVNKLLAPIEKGSAYLANQLKPNQLTTGQKQLMQQRSDLLKNVDLEQLSGRDQVELFKRLNPEASLTWGQRLGDSWNQAEQKLMSVPFIGDAIRHARKGVEQEFAKGQIRNVAQEAGIDIPAKMGNRKAFEALQKGMNEKYNAVLEQTTLPRPDILRSKIVGTLDNAGDYVSGTVSSDYNKLSEAGQKKFNKILEEDIFKRFGKDPQGNYSIPMTGKQFKGHEEKMKETINNLMNGTGEERDIGLALRKSLDSMYDMLQSPNANVAQEIKALNRTYAKFKTLESASVASGASRGHFTPTQIVNAAKRGAGKSSIGQGRNDLAVEAELAQMVHGDKVPDSGTASRLLAAAALGGAGWGATGDPALVAGLGAGGYGLTRALYNPAFIRSLSTGSTKTGQRLDDLLGRTHLGRGIQNQAGNLSRALAQYKGRSKGSVEEQEEEEDDEHARGGEIDRLPSLAEHYLGIRHRFAMGGMVSPLGRSNEVLQHQILSQQLRAQNPSGIQSHYPAPNEHVPTMAGPKMASGGFVNRLANTRNLMEMDQIRTHR